MTNNVVPIFYACDDAFVKYTIVSLKSMIANASRDRRYHVYILNTEISEDMTERLLELQNDNFEITIQNVSHMLESIQDRLPLRHYYSKTTYYRFFISELFTEYKKAIYIDSDTIVCGDISELYDTDIGESYVGAAHEMVMVQTDVYGTYCEKVVGVDRYNFFNAGIMLINCEKFREKKVLSRFIELLNVYTFVVTQDEDYLNLICKDHVYFLDQRWNSEMEGELSYPIEEAKIIHYIMIHKPWHYEDCKHGDIFWSYAKDSSVYGLLADELNSYSDEKKENDKKSAESLMQMALDEIARPDNYINMLNSSVRDKGRVEVVKRIEEKELSGDFSTDVEDDPPSRELVPGEVDFLRKKLTSKIKQAYAFSLAKKFVKKITDSGELVIKDVIGVENLKNLDTGAIITSNHFNAFDSFILHLAYMRSGHKKRKLYRVIREGNYTSFPGFYGYLMRNFYTLPLSKNRRVMHEFFEATDTLLKDGNFVLIYPEQSMWWNYRKPKPLKEGAFTLAMRSGVPVLPCFITMRDTERLGRDGYPIQEHTVHIGKPIYPNPELDSRENVRYMLKENERVWREIYEREYGMPLVYKTK